MSRSNANEQIENPCTRYFEWSSDNKCFSYWDKINKVKALVKLPFRFIVLDQLATVKGYDKAAKSSYWSNEVRNVKTDMLTVRNKQGEVISGLYENIIASRDLTGARFCKSVYICYFEGKEMYVGNIAMVGTALGAWIDFGKKEKSNVMKKAISVSKSIEGINGKTAFNTPVFSVIDISMESDKRAIELDATLQTYLVERLKTKKSDSHEEIPDNLGEPPIEVTAEATMSNVKKTVQQSDEESDLPF